MTLALAISRLSHGEIASASVAPAMPPPTMITLMSLLFSNYAVLQERRLKHWCGRKCLRNLLTA
ncbi:hypothetical protein, partial [Pseudomonas aeruginosa]|uniref:hypothetical protein n=1 Tax=Pseudomonas aeruginosa TaxID=287 RepID=UPI0031B733A9